MLLSKFLTLTKIYCQMLEKNYSNNLGFIHRGNENPRIFNGIYVNGEDLLAQIMPVSLLWPSSPVLSWRSPLELHGLQTTAHLLHYTPINEKTATRKVYRSTALKSLLKSIERPTYSIPFKKITISRQRFMPTDLYMIIQNVNS